MSSGDSGGVFLSYHSSHRRCAASLNDFLVAAGIDVWADWERIGRRDDWRTLVSGSLPGFDLLVAIGGSDYLSSPNCVFEWEFALEAGIPRIRLENAHSDLLASSTLAGVSTGRYTCKVRRLARSLAMYSTSPSIEDRCCLSSHPR